MGRKALQLLFGECHKSRDDTRRAAIVVVLPNLMDLSAWHFEVESLEKRLESLRHDAIEDPTLATFHPLARLRRNIAHLQTELRMRQREPAEHEVAYSQPRERLKDASDYPATLTESYATLTQRNVANSTALDYEVQLVIGPVTVQV